ncbi:Metal-nicotianamine transporter like [Actinidia chinensis var. chinensis]|uniref:Metal-nicotianamine transporter like n=1 Tax=Actinidia chinensis var. chinensis TaxID=1590841 RepID=A0A2R6QMU7_ACTCC|nr:Metal-nicotianamine transporter like [Actinidia chinensis var. chinensis]
MRSVGSMEMETDRNGKREIEDDGEELHDELEWAKRIPPWTRQITLRGVIASFVIGGIYSIIAMKLNLTTGMTPNLNVSAALLGYIFMHVWTKMLQKFGIVTVPFTRQENTMIQTCAVACYGIAVGGGFGSYLLGLNKKTYELAGVDAVGNSVESYKEPGIGWMVGFLFVVCFVGLFVLIPLRKILIIDYKLTFPSGMATAVLINGFHNQGEKMARKQLRGFVKYFSFSFLWGFFQWFYTGKEECGFAHFPTFGLQALKNTFYFDFSMTYVGTGMICPYIVNISTLLGAVLSWGVMWPLIGNLKGEWFPTNLSESDMKGLNGYKVFLSISLLLGDGLYNFVKILCITFLSIHGRLKQKNLNLAVGNQDKSLDDERKNEFFIRESIPMWVGTTGYIFFTLVSVIAIPFIFPEVKWYYVIVAYIFAPSLAFCNAYGAGLTDINMAYNYGKVGLFALAALAGREHGVVAGLAGCGLLKSVINVSCILMQDFKTGHLTLTSPRAMLLSQAIGTAIGCVVSPLSFFLFYKAFDVGNPNGEYKAPYALIYRNLAILGVQGFSMLPRHCLQLCCGFFAFAVGVNLVKDFSPPKVGKWLPLPMAMAVPFLVGAYFAIDLCVGSLIVFVWHKLNSKKAEQMVPVVASGLICGEGLWTLPASVLSLAKINPPMCMKFLDS